MRISERAATAGTTTRTLRSYEGAKVLPPTERTANGYRDHGPEAPARLDFIRRGRAAGMALARIRGGDRHPRLRRRAVRSCAPTAHGARCRH